MRDLYSSICSKIDNESFFVCHEDTRMSGAELVACISKIAAELSSYSKCNIGLLIKDPVCYIKAYLSVLSLSSTAVPITATSTESEVVNDCKYCDVSLLITDTNDIEAEYDTYSLTSGKLTPRIYDCISNDPEVAIMLHTSGTTSNPKRVMLTYENLLANTTSNIKALGLSNQDKTLITLPLNFGYCNNQLLSHLRLGADIVIMDGPFMPKRFFETIQKHQVTNTTMVPTQLLMCLNYHYSDKYDTTSLRYICFGGGSMPVAKLRQLIDVFPHTGLVQTYGQTEAGPRTTALMPQDAIRKIGSVGRPIPDVEVRIVDEKDNEVRPGEIGEIIIRGKNVMKGYYKNPEATSRVLRNGWLYTGDLGKYDNEMYLYLTGRKRNIIIKNGINIYPEEVEEVLLRKPEIKEVLVYGVDDEISGEVPKAKIVLHNDMEGVSEENLKAYCRSFLSEYKIPVSFEIVKTLNRTHTGKVKRYGNR